MPVCNSSCPFRPSSMIFGIDSDVNYPKWELRVVPCVLMSPVGLCVQSRVRRQVLQSTAERAEATSARQIPTGSQRPGTGCGPPRQGAQPGAGSTVSGLWYRTAGTDGSTEEGGVLCSLCGVRLVPDGPPQSLSAEPHEEGISPLKGPVRYPRRPAPSRRPS